MANVTLYAPGTGAPVIVSDTPAPYVARLLARGYTEAPPGPPAAIYTKTVLASAARNADGESNAIVPDAKALEDDEFTLGLQITAVAGAAPNLVLSVQWFSSAAGVWFDQDPAVQFAPRAVAGAWMLAVKPRGDLYRVKWDVTDTVTFSVFEMGDLTPE